MLASWYQVKHADYPNSGFNRGYLCPSDDRDSRAEENKTTFLLTNILSQAPQLNRQSWLRLEDYCRSLVAQGNELYIIAGTQGKGGEGDNGPASSLANGKLCLPAAPWKVIVVMSVGSDDLSRINAQTRVIAVFMPNANVVGQQSWANYRVNIGQIEK
ncbi:DNA/RNA non-specific endonuclease [Spirosoma endbachense]|uniref:DNA/RNA non-specific endonuclease n=1 Tax=Spirosoma endbachense TaxID=2666025 RepID=UPI001E4BF1AF|nr:DNA/RNA non-specific endonuclease [Spirosoma endbachense]